MRTLVVNAGSSSLKLSVVGEDDATLERIDAPAIGTDDAGFSSALAAVLNRHGPVAAVGHRIVHGGREFRDAVRVDAAVLERLASLVDLAPLHQPASVAALQRARAALPGVPHVACFDTAFHASIPDAAATYAVPAPWRARWPLQRFGFHGLSHAWASRRAAEVLGRPLIELRLITAHLGAGASLAAVAGGRSVDTTMGFTPLEGLVMATRSGSVDPGLLLWLLRTERLSAEEIERGLERESGILGLGGTADMRELLAATEAGSTRARLARDVYVHRLCGGIAAMAAAMNGFDALVFTGGVGENAPAIRALALRGLAFLGLAADPARNEGGQGDREIGPVGATPAAVVVASREDVEIVRQVRSLLGG